MPLVFPFNYLAFLFLSRLPLLVYLLATVLHTRPVRKSASPAPLLHLLTMDQIAAQINDLFEFPIDFEGQKKVDHIINLYVFVLALLSVLVGFVTQNLFLLLVTFASVLVVTLIIVLPAWPQYKKNPVQWLQVKYDL